MKTSISITGSVLRDRDDSSRRNYESFVISTVAVSSVSSYGRHVHVSNYAANAKSAAHRMLTKSHSTSKEALDASADMIRRKLERNRVTLNTFSETFSDESELIAFINKSGLKLTVSQVATIKNDVAKFLAESEAKDEAIGATSKEDHFIGSIERQLSGEEMMELEERMGFGKNTKLSNSNWGSF